MVNITVIVNSDEIGGETALEIEVIGDDTDEVIKATRKLMDELMAED